MTSTSTESPLPTSDQEQYDRDLAYAMQLQEQFEMEQSGNASSSGYSHYPSHQKNWRQIHNDEEYAKTLQTLINGTETLSMSSHWIHEPREEKLFSADTVMDEEDILRNYEEDLIEQSYYHFEVEEDDSTGPNQSSSQKIERKNHNFDKDQKDRFSLSDHMKVEFPGTHFNQNVVEQLNHVQRIQEKTRVRRKDKKSRATVENVLDQRTLLLLFKMINNDETKLLRMHGCVSTGKEANVYYAEGKGDTTLAVKIFKTSMLQFRDRDRYVSGEFRFRKGYSKSNARKMVEKWATKEFTNMHKMYRAGIPCPQPYDQVKHVFVMEFLGKDGWPARRLKDANLSKKKLTLVYRQLVKLMRNIYHKAKLVHADLSEYNILYHNQQLYIIDVSQAVSHDHPNALEFLRSDCHNVSQFFIKSGFRHIMTLRELFDFVVSHTIPEESVDTYLDVALQKAEERGELAPELHTDDAVFKQAFIPRTLDQVENIEQHFQSVKEGIENTDQLFYREVCGINMDLSGIAQVPEYLRAAQEEAEQRKLVEQQQDEKDFLAEDEGVEDDSDDVDPLLEQLNEKERELFIQFSKDIGKMLGAMEKKDRKQYVKDMKRQKREVKIPKAEKQRAETLGKRRKGKKKA